MIDARGWVWFTDPRYVGEELRELDFEGVFVVEPDGTMTNLKIVRDLDAGCGQAALDVFRKMQALESPWTPGIQNGEPIRVVYTLPATFKLER